MHPFVCLSALLALLARQAEPAADPPPAAPPAEERTAPPVQAADPAQPASRARPQAPAEGQERTAAPGRPAEPERAQVARAALAFLDALLAGDAAALAAASTERFSFDGDVRTGKDELRRTWRGFLAGRDASRKAELLDLELLTAADALSRLGPPPPRLAPLASARGGWVAIANVSRRPVVLFLGREGNRWAVTGIE